MARAGDVRNWSSHRVDRCAGLLLVAAARRAARQSALGSEARINCVCLQNQRNSKWPPGRLWLRNVANVRCLHLGDFARNVQIDEQSGASHNGQNQAKRETNEEKAALKGSHKT